MQNNIFVDMNIWLYVLMKGNNKKTRIAGGIIQQANIVVSTQVVNEIHIELIVKP